jgi:hypothetical protein
MMSRTSTLVGTSLLRLESADFRYEPFPIAYSSPSFQPDVYEELVDTWPAQELFAFMPKLGKKYSLSELNEPANYHAFLERTPIWNAIYREIKSPAFVRSVLDLLQRYHINLGIPADVEVNSTQKQGGSPSAWTQKIVQKDIKALKTRFEFSMLPADGGHIKPHTDSPGKVITLVASMVRPGEWNAAWGGGTTVLRAKHVRDSFNFMNRQLDFEDTEVLATYPFEPNQCVTFVKTFNSLHAVSPLTGLGTDAMRKTLTINIEIA